MKSSVRSKATLGMLLLGVAVGGTAWAQRGGSASVPGIGGIYTCVDGQGRRLTSDRPIVECIDREQKELSNSGTVRRTIPPSMTAPELAAKEERDRKAAEEVKRLAEEKRRERAMLARYPNQAAHDAERARALNAIQEVIFAGNRRTVDLQEQHKKLMVEAEFFSKDPSKMPLKLKRDLEENAKTLEAQQRFLANQDEEKGRVNKRFDEELARLKVLWAQLRAGAAPAVATAPAAAASADYVRR